ncbi:MAG: glycosyltransferase [Rickettsiales bacterium]|jgi:glycosyltransferase involved in cell wall biosynthesis|nr:glycosyltransferase [Rickettsiales bacterium]
MDIANKNVLYVIPTMDSGGVEVGVVEIAKQNFLKHGFNMFVLCSSGLLRNRLTNLGVEVIILDVKTKNPAKLYLNIKKIEKILVKYKIDLVSSESRAPAWSCYFACKNLNIPFVATVHGAYNNRAGIFTFLKKLYNSIMFRGDNMIFVSQYIKEYSIKFFKKHIIKKDKIKNTAVIHRGIDLGIFNPKNVSQNRVLEIQNKLKIPDDRPIILVPARFVKIKGHIYFLKVLRFLTLYNRDYVCIMVGDVKKHPKFLETVQKHIAMYKLSEFVKIHDNIVDMPALYTLSNIVVSSSIKPESFGRVAVEAQSMGKIFIGTALGGTLETVENGKTGFLAPPDDETVFAKILLEIMAMSEEEKQVIEHNAIKSSKKYSLDNMYNKTLEFYKLIFETQ